MAKKKTKVAETPSNVDAEKAIDVAINALRKKFGDDVVNWMNKAPEEERNVIPTGSVSLDAALQVGGIVKGRLYEFFGPPSSGKTTLAISIIKEVQKLGGKVAYIDAEHTLDASLLKSMGVDTSGIAIVKGYTGEENLDVAKALICTGNFDLCVIDSVSALQPSAEANLESFSDNTMGLHPRLMARMSRDLTPRASRTKTALILINQVRSNMTGYGNPETTSGGNALRHHITGKIRVSGAGVKSRQILDSKGLVIGHKAKFQVLKNKLGVPFREAEVDLIYGKGFHTASELLDLGVDMGLIEQSGSWFSYNDEKIGQGRAKAITHIDTNEEVKRSLMDQVRDVLGLSQENE